jgi:hypothetical protein
VTVIPIARYLMEFGSGGARAGDDGASGRSAASGRAVGEEEIARRIEAAVAQAREDARAEAELAFAERLARERAGLAQEAAAQRDAWLAGEGARLGEAMACAMGRIEAMIAESVAHVLRPFLASALRNQALTALEETLSTLLSSNPAQVRVSGPKPLVDAVRERMGAGHEGVEYGVSDGADIRVVADQTVIETRMKAWIDALDPAAR